MNILQLQLHYESFDISSFNLKDKNEEEKEKYLNDRRDAFEALCKARKEDERNKLIKLFNKVTSGKLIQAQKSHTTNSYYAIFKKGTKFYTVRASDHWVNSGDVLTDKEIKIINNIFNIELIADNTSISVTATKKGYLATQDNIEKAKTKKYYNRELFNRTGQVKIVKRIQNIQGQLVKVTYTDGDIIYYHNFVPSLIRI